MTEREFAYWLQGFFEMTDAKVLTEAQVKMIKDHLGYVFNPKIKQTEQPVVPQDVKFYPDITTGIIC